MRRAILLWHRWVGLALATFLIVEGLTGSLLAFKEPITLWLAPQYFATAPAPGAQPLPLAVLASRAETLAPNATLGFFSVEPHQAVMRMYDRPGAPPLGWHLMFLDPWTGRELGHVQGDRLSEGPIAWMGFVYAIHQSLLLGEWGTFALGVMATVWTIDCFLAVVLTLPITRRDFWRRWRKAWGIKRRGSSTYRLNLDLHRAGSLWLWLVLLVFAWSGVMLTLTTEVYEPVTAALVDTQTFGSIIAMAARRKPDPAPRLDWFAAEAAGERLMAQAARQHHFTVQHPFGMAYIAPYGVYTYAVVADANVSNHAWETSLWLDSRDGHLVSLDLPSGQHTGNTIGTWLHAFHYADLRDSLAYRWTVFLFGILLAGLSTTGVVIWWIKRGARQVRDGRDAGLAVRPGQPGHL
jgi:uncharacterized iron-regulated membrane protein